MEAIAKSTFAGGIVNLTVGPDEVPFDAHVELLCSKSAFFDNALKGRFSEAETKHILLPEDDSQAFAELLSWWYCGQISIKIPVTTTWITLCKLWVLSDKYNEPALQNHVIGLMSKKWIAQPMNNKGNIIFTTIKYVYDNTMPNSLLRDAIRDITVFGMDIGKFAKFKANYPKDFLEDFSLHQMKRVTGRISHIPAIQSAPAQYFVKVDQPDGTGR